MGLFQRRPQIADPVNYFSSGLHKTVLLVGLGNPGREYDLTRHNVGFACLDSFAAQNSFDPWMNKQDLKCHLTSQLFGDTRAVLIKPTTFMNNSGEAVQAVMTFYKIAPEQVAVVHDELDVDFGLIRTRQGGGSAGHNGIKSIIQHVHDSFGRVRVGIGPKTPAQMDSAAFVLQKFGSDEQAKLPALTKETAALLSEFIYGGAQLPADTRNFLL